MSIIFTQNLGFKLPALNYWSHPEQIQDHNVIVKLQTIDNLEKPNKPSLHSTITHNTVTRYIYSVYWDKTPWHWLTVTGVRTPQQHRQPWVFRSPAVRLVCASPVQADNSDNRHTLGQVFLVTTCHWTAEARTWLQHHFARSLLAGLLTLAVVLVLKPATNVKISPGAA